MEAISYYASFALIPLFFLIRLVKNSVKLQAQAWRWSVFDTAKVIDSHRRSYNR